MNWTQYRTNLWRYLHIHWLWTRDITGVEPASGVTADLHDGKGYQPLYWPKRGGYPALTKSEGIEYREGWTPIKLALLSYCGWALWLPLGALASIWIGRWALVSLVPAVASSSYLISTLLGHSIRPFSGVLWERAGYNFTKRFQGDPFQHPNAELLAVRFLNWITRDPKHCYKAARAAVLWGSRSARQ